MDKFVGAEMAENLDPDRKTCFVISPIGNDDSETRIRADWVLEEIIEPVFADFTEFRVERADRVALPGLIDEQVIGRILTATICIADLTTLNPNVFYEIGIRHSIGRPIIHIHEESEQIPFDISAYRSIKFSRKRVTDIKNARKSLRQAVDAALASNYVIANPVTRAMSSANVRTGFWTQEEVMELFARWNDDWVQGTFPDAIIIRVDFAGYGTGTVATHVEELVGRCFERVQIWKTDGEWRLIMPPTPKNRNGWDDFRWGTDNIVGVVKCTFTLPKSVLDMLEVVRRQLDL
jgi:hypothetical protein